MQYQPPQIILDRYADVLVNFALNSGKGIVKGEVVQCIIPDVAKPLLMALYTAILKSGGHPVMRMLPSGLDKIFYEHATNEQLAFFPRKYIKSRVELIDHSIGILADHDLHELQDIEPAKIIKTQEAQKEARTWMSDKEYAGKFTWTLALYGTPAMAKEANLSIEAYWQEIIQACFLDREDPLSEWRKISAKQLRIKQTLNQLDIRKIHIEARDTDLWLTMGDKRQWVGGGGRNIPSFEIFTSPDWRGTEGHISFNQPLYRYGKLITDVRLHFKRGKVVQAYASKNQELLTQMIARPDADKVGEFSMTDSSMSRITKFMANTLFDENIGDTFGNTHIAIGMSYKDAYAGNPITVTKREWKALGFNDSGEHCDIISTTDRVITAILADGSSKVIFAKGRFQV
jgi:aminopeptidase